MDGLTNRWLSALGIAAVCFGLFLFVLRVPVRTIGIFFVLGIPLILLWLYVDDKSKQQEQQKWKISNNSDNNNNLLQQQRRCICVICKHEKADICLNQKCPCCIMMNGDRIIGHHTNPLQ
jgi:hypothetical protein